MLLTNNVGHAEGPKLIKETLPILTRTAICDAKVFANLKSDFMLSGRRRFFTAGALFPAMAARFFTTLFAFFVSILVWATLLEIDFVAPVCLNQLLYVMQADCW